MKTDTFTSVINENSINKCLEYSEEPEELKKLLSSTANTDVFLDVLIKFDGIKKHFPDDKEERLTGIFKLKRGGNDIEFNFGFSIADTEIFIKNQSYKYKGKFYDGAMGSDLQKNKDKKEFMNDLLYSCLACCSMDYYVPIDFDEFCGEFGYDTDSIKAEDTWKRCLKQSSKLHRIFKEDEINFLPS